MNLASAWRKAPSPSDTSCILGQAWWAYRFGINCKCLDSWDGMKYLLTRRASEALAIVEHRSLLTVSKQLFGILISLLVEVVKFVSSQSWLRIFNSIGALIRLETRCWISYALYLPICCFDLVNVSEAVRLEWCFIICWVWVVCIARIKFIYRLLFH